IRLLGRDRGGRRAGAHGRRSRREAVRRRSAAAAEPPGARRRDRPARARRAAGRDRRRAEAVPTRRCVVTPASDAAARWLCTFAVHSALFAALALAFASLVRQRALAWQDATLRLALLGGLATSVLQLAVCGGPLVSWGAAATMFAAPPTNEQSGAS